MKNKIIITITALVLCLITGIVLLVNHNAENKADEDETVTVSQNETVTQIKKTELSTEGSKKETESRTQKKKNNNKKDIAKPLIKVDAAKYFGAVSTSTVYNNELQSYLSSQASISENRIRLTAKKLDDIYISGKVETKIAFRYGEFKFRINTMEGKGLFPAIWLLSKDGVLLPEIDIYEALGNENERFYGVMHYKKDGKQMKQTRSYTFKGPVPKYMELTFKWTKDKMIWLADGKEVFRIDKDVPQIPVYMIINLAVGGDWPGNPDSKTKFPAVFDVEILEFNPTEIYSRA